MLGSGAVGAIQVKDVPADLHEAARERAKARGQTLSEYVLLLIREDMERMSREEWLARVKAHGQLISDDVDVAAIIREIREEMDGGPPDRDNSRR